MNGRGASQCAGRSLYSALAAGFGGAWQRRGPREPCCRCLGGVGRSLCAEAAPGFRHWGAASRPPTPDNSARGGEPRVPGNFSLES